MRLAKIRFPRLRDLPIRKKLHLVILATTASALFVAGAALLLQELINFRRNLHSDLENLSRLIGHVGTPSLVFEDPVTAGEILSALRFDPQVTFAAFYLPDGERIASFERRETGERFPARPAEFGIRFHRESVSFFAPIFDQRASEEAGAIHLVADYSLVRSRLVSYGGIVFFALAVSMVGAYLISSRVQRVVSVPILNLADAARRVSESHDYSARAHKSGEDEIGVFIDAFNNMLARIQVQDQQLQRSHDELEHRVHERTLELERQAAELARSNADLEQFAYVASHDLQEPLRMVSNYTQLLARRYKDRLDDDAHEFIRFAVDGATRMQGLIQDLLQYSRVGTRGKAFGATDCEEALAVAKNDLRRALEEAGAKITHDPLPTIQADPTQLTQLFLNLLSNAIKFRGEEPPSIHVSAARGDGEWLFTVQDNGIGLDQEYADRIFVIFQRLHGFSEYSGTGIGLAICKKIVERHGGRIWVESKRGEGAKFSFTIPFEPGHDTRHVSTQQPG